MIAWILKLGPWLAGLVGIIAGLFLRQQAKTTTAEAKQEVAEVKQQDAEKQAVAAQSGADAVKERTHVENTIAAAPAGDSAAKLRDQWSRD